MFNFGGVAHFVCGVYLALFAASVIVAEHVLAWGRGGCCDSGSLRLRRVRSRLRRWLAG